MNAAHPRQSGIGFFIALLIVVPAATWVGMIIPETVLQVYHRVQTVVEGWGILGEVGLRATAGQSLATAADGGLVIPTSAPWSIESSGEISRQLEFHRTISYTIQRPAVGIQLPLGPCPLPRYRGYPRVKQEKV